MVDVLIGTFIGDTAAYFGGRPTAAGRWRRGSRRTRRVEGLVAGVLGGTLAFWFAGLYQDWLSGPDALLIGLGWRSPRRWATYSSRS